MVINQESQHQGSQATQLKQQQGIFATLMQKVGNKGKYQFSLFITLSAVSLITGAVILVTPFLFYQDTYQCDSSMKAKQCLDFVCSLSPSERASFVPQTPYIYSFANRFGDYRCPAEQSQLDLIKTIFFSGQLVGFFASSLIGDMVRSKILMVGGLILTLLGALIVVFSGEIWIGVFGMFLFTTGPTVAFNLTYIFITEMVQEKRRQTYKVVIASIFSVGALTNVLWFYLLPNYKTVLLIFFAIPVAVLATIFAKLFKDTPISLITKNTPQKAYEDLLYIAHFNGIQEPDFTVEEIQQTQEKYKQSFSRKSSPNKAKKFNILDLFRYKSLRLITLLLIVLDCVFYLQYLAPTLMLNQFHFNIFLNGAVIQSAQLFVFFIGYFTIKRVPRRLYGMVSFSIIAGCSIVLCFIWDQHETGVTNVGANIVVLAFVFVIELTVSNAFNFYAVYLNQLYPTQVRLIGIGFIKTFGSLTAMVSSQIINLCLNTGFKIMALFAILAIMSIIIYYLLPQTQGKKPPEVIIELMSAREEQVKEPVQDYQDMVEESDR